MSAPGPPGRSRARISEIIIAVGVIVGFCYWAEVVILTLILSILIAYFLDPVVQALEKIHVPRPIGALIMVLFLIAALVSIGMLTGNRFDRVFANLPKYSTMLQNALSAAAEHIEHLLETYLRMRPLQGGGGFGFVLAEEGSLRDLLLRGLGSLYSFIWVVAFIPFLVFFMLSEKDKLWYAALNLFPSSARAQARQGLDELSSVLRGYIVGNVMVAGVLVLTSWLFFWLIGLNYAFLSALFSGFLNLVPYLGAVLALGPPFAAGLLQWTGIGPFLGVAVVLMLFHLLAINALFPALVGRRVRVNAVAVTISLLFWGWMWGGIGLLLAIPIVATLKVVCDHVEAWRPLGRLLDASPAPET